MENGLLVHAVSEVLETVSGSITFPQPRVSEVLRPKIRLYTRTPTHRTSLLQQMTLSVPCGIRESRRLFAIT